MDTILKIPLLHRYNISDHLEFHQQSYVICNKHLTNTGETAEISKVMNITDPGDLIAAYHDALKQEENVYQWLRRSQFTEKKAETDHARDNIYKGILAIVRNDMKHFDPAMRAHAVHVNYLLEAHDNAMKADYDAETASIDTLLPQLRSSKYQDAVTALGLTPWINQLDSENTLFKTYVDDTAQEQTAKPKITPRAARSQTDDALRQITNFVTSVIVLIGKKGHWAGFMNEFNTVVNHFNVLVHEHYGRTHTHIDIKQSVIDPIPEQPYAGKPVFVIPDLTLTVEHDGKQTVLHPLFSEDFSVAYRNNKKPGTATLFIRGIGKYTGEIITTFSIV
jgi:hypothetical protein